MVPDGGKVVLGSSGGEDTQNANAYLSADAYVVVREGAVIDVSGTSAQLDVVTIGAARAEHVGAPHCRQQWRQHRPGFGYQGIYNDGTLLAACGRRGRLGRHADDQSRSADLQRCAERHRTLAPAGGPGAAYLRARQPSALPADLQVGAAHQDLRPGHASLSAEQVEEGGFDNLSLFARTAIVFEAT